MKEKIKSARQLSRYNKRQINAKEDSELPKVIAKKSILRGAASR
jgi:hypothetical protein